MKASRFGASPSFCSSRVFIFKRGLDGQVRLIDTDMTIALRTMDSEAVGASLSLLAQTLVQEARLKTGYLQSSFLL
jgi:hypothetical protein